MEQAENVNQTLNDDFSVLTEENRKSVIEMIKFLIITQNTIVPELLNNGKTQLNGEDEKIANRANRGGAGNGISHRISKYKEIFV